VAIVGNVRSERIHRNSMLFPDHEHAGFGSLLYDESSELVLHAANKTWLYATGLLRHPRIRHDVTRLGSVPDVTSRKSPGGYLKGATEADRLGMGMTNRAIPAQGEMRGATFTLSS
jgi:hypothetical protein